MNKRKKASYGMKKMRGGDYMEPNKELKFGAAKGMKPKRKRAVHGNTVPGAGAARRREMEEETTRNSPNPPASTDPKKGTSVGSQAAKDIKNPYAAAKKRDSNLDSYVKQRNAADKGSLEYNEAQNKINKAYGKGPTDRRTTYGPEKKSETAKAASTGKSAATAMASQSKTKPTLKANMVSTSKPAAKPAAEPTGRAKRVAARADNKEGRLQDRRASAAKRKSARSRKDTAAAAQKERGATRGMQRAAGRMTKANIKGNEAKANRAVNKFQDKSKRAAAKAKVSAIKKEGKAALADAKGRKRAMTGLAVQGAGAALQGVGKLTNAIAGKETKFGNIADTVGSTAVTAGGMMGGVPGAQGALNAVKGAVPPPGGAGAAPTPADPNAPTDPNANASVEQAANRPMRRGGKKRKKYQEGGKMTPMKKKVVKRVNTSQMSKRNEDYRKALDEGEATLPFAGGKPKSMTDSEDRKAAKNELAKKKKLKMKTGGAKPDYLDMDKDGNKTESMKSALKDRRSKARMGKKR